MRKNKVATVYAQSLLNIGKEKNSLDSLKEELEAVSSVFSEFPEFNSAFSSPRVTQRNKVTLLENVFKGKISPVVLNFLKILVRKRREDQFENIRFVYNDLMDEAMNRIHVYVKTAVEPDNNFLPKIKEIINKKSGKTAIVHLELAPAIIGGAVIQIADIVADFSVSRELESLREKIISCKLKSEEIYEN
jgi:F-type H+-transporting ATPase subunit delta